MSEQRPQLGVGAYLVGNEGILLGFRINPHAGNVWSAPGGHYEHGETPQAAARREALEETGIEVPEPLWRFRAITSDFFAESGKHYITLHLVAQVSGAEPMLTEPDKWREWRWFPLDDLPTPLMPSFVNALGCGLDFSTKDQTIIASNF